MTVAVRPERIEAHGSRVAATIAEGVVERRTYLGDLVELGVAVDDLEITVQTQNRAGGDARQVEIGARVFLTWDQESSLVLTGDVDDVADQEARRLVDSNHGAE